MRIHISKSRLKRAFGWAYRAWSHPFVWSPYVSEIVAKDTLHILEIGASPISMVATVFDKPHNKITIGYYKNAQSITQALQTTIHRHQLQAEYNVCYVDAHNIQGTYDVIVMKSVLGGVFRTPTTNISQVQTYMQTVIDNHINTEGYLILLDNGASFVEKYLSSYGARKNDWRYFTPNDINTPHNTTHCKNCFGVVSLGTFATRIGKIGAVLDTLIYFIDTMLYRIYKKHPTIICRVYHKNPP